MTDSELRERAITACRNYCTVYGAYPGKVGIHWRRLSHMQQTYINFPVMQPVTTYPFGDASLPVPAPSFSMQLVPFEGVQGDTIQWNEVYLPVLSMTLEETIVSGEQIAVMAGRRLHADNRL